MSNNESIIQLLNIIKEGCTKFKDMINKNLTYTFRQERINNGIIVHFWLKYSEDLDYMIGLTNLTENQNFFAEIVKHEKLDLSQNPFRKLKYSDETMILSCIYEELKNIKFDNIACYKNLGIILTNPLDLQGIFNINVKFNIS